MKKVLYITNKEVPYRVAFFNQLAMYSNLTVAFESIENDTRDKKWAHSIRKEFYEVFLDGSDAGKKKNVYWNILKLLKQKWDVIIVGCFNSKVQLMAMLYMRFAGTPFWINLDGELFINQSLKGMMKKFFLHGAKGYLIAGEKAGENLKSFVGVDKKINPYWFSSLTNKELSCNAQIEHKRPPRTVLIVGRYYKYKGMDVAFMAASRDHSINYKFVGMGKQSEQFCKNMGELPENIEIIPFLQKKELEEEYKNCSLMVLPSRQECWGLVINEAASFGTPIVSTWGSGAAVEFLSDAYPQYLAIPGDAESLYNCIKMCLQNDNTHYSKFLKQKSAQYSIENSVKAHMKLINSI